jgi:hypothetical protein
MSKDKLLVSFDWAAKQMPRNKANCEVVEGFLSELLGRDVKIINVLENENPEDGYDRIDVVIDDYEMKEVSLVEMYFSAGKSCFSRMVYGVSKAVVDNVSKDDFLFLKIQKVYAINIIFDIEMKENEDYIYHCQTLFEEVHTQEKMTLSYGQRKLFNINNPEDIYPEYFILIVNNFPDIVESKLDEWAYFLKNNQIKEEFSAKGLLEAREILDFDKLSQEEKAEYEASESARRAT